MSINKDTSKETLYKEKRLFASMVAKGLDPLHSAYLNPEALEIVESLMKQLLKWGYVHLESVDCNSKKMRVERVYVVNVEKYQNRAKMIKELRKIDTYSVRGMILHNYAKRFLEL